VLDVGGLVDDDPLRIMRTARFAAQLCFDVEMDVMDAMTEMAPRLEIVSAERVRAELERLLLAPRPRRGRRSARRSDG